jgi:hypothetical protein
MDIPPQNLLYVPTQFTVFSSYAASLGLVLFRLVLGYSALNDFRDYNAVI